MTAPSNANTSGLENAGHIVLWKAGGVSYYPEGEAFTVSESCRVEPLVTAASAQARIAELERWQSAAIRSARIHDENIRDFDARATAAEARADRLAKALERIAHPEYGLGFNKLRGIARAALQQETQP